MSEAVFLELIALGKFVAALISVVTIIALLRGKAVRKVFFEIPNVAKLDVEIDTSVDESSEKSVNNVSE